ncbi:hypothetical protein [Aromatoleum anaerobium]|uniref:Uncharacterized protein n=1 Tax=Aromatoleum anaerobium TaxID=182180 RepID=A0ABX1PKC1_9RHOO|nr:hypothetical protein [Aromatoleum anaerobium]MCK0507216.1 hypothetical protein [Aromatoleum anaerobium]
MTFSNATAAGLLSGRRFCVGVAEDGRRRRTTRQVLDFSWVFPEAVDGPAGRLAAGRDDRCPVQLTKLPLAPG